MLVNSVVTSVSIELATGTVSFKTQAAELDFVAGRCQLIIQPESNLLRTTRISGRQVQEVLRGRKRRRFVRGGRAVQLVTRKALHQLC